MQSNTHAYEYAELRRLLAQQGLFDRQPVYYTGKALLNFSFLVLALGLLAQAHHAQCGGDGSPPRRKDGAHQHNPGPRPDPWSVRDRRAR